MSAGPSATVDVIIEYPDRRIVLIERKFDPPGWAIPGGFVDAGESCADAARREAREETSLDVELSELFHVYSDPRRDPRRHTLSVVYLGVAAPGAKLAAADDAKDARLFRLNDLPSLAFDHATIIDDYRLYRADGTRPPTDR